eukprot:2625715-Prymnesium_polylepis.2
MLQKRWQSARFKCGKPAVGTKAGRGYHKLEPILGHALHQVDPKRILLKPGRCGDIEDARDSRDALKKAHHCLGLVSQPCTFPHLPHCADFFGDKFDSRSTDRQSASNDQTAAA